MRALKPSLRRELLFLFFAIHLAACGRIGLIHGDPNEPDAPAFPSDGGGVSLMPVAPIVRAVFTDPTGGIGPGASTN